MTVNDSPLCMWLFPSVYPHKCSSLLGRLLKLPTWFSPCLHIRNPLKELHGLSILGFFVYQFSPKMFLPSFYILIPKLSCPSHWLLKLHVMKVGDQFTVLVLFQHQCALDTWVKPAPELAHAAQQEMTGNMFFLRQNFVFGDPTSHVSLSVLWWLLLNFFCCWDNFYIGMGRTVLEIGFLLFLFLWANSSSIMSLNKIHFIFYNYFQMDMCILPELQIIILNCHRV